MTQTDPTDTANRPLSDVTVVELGHIAAGPFCSLLLAELGAEVVKIEHRASGGDSVRDSTPVGNSLFNAVNRNKQSVSIDLKTEGGLAAFETLIAETDVFVENLRPGAPDRLGIGYDDLRSVNDGLVYCSIKGFNEGPYQDLPALDPVAEALSGLMSVTGHSGSPPARAGTSVADMTAALFGAFGIVGALRQRATTGEGQHLTAPLFESTVSLMGYWLAYTQAYDDIPEPIGAGHDNWAPYNVYRSADERWVFVGPSSQRDWEALCRALDIELHERPAFETLADRRENEAELDTELGGVIGEHDAETVVSLLRAADVPVALVQNLKEVTEDDHMAATGGFVDVDTVAGAPAEVSVPRFPVRSSGFEPPAATDPPELGEHTERVLRGLGYSDGEIERLRAEGCL